MLFSAASFRPSTAASICTSVKFARSWAIRKTVATTSKPCEAWDTSSRIPGSKPPPRLVKARKHEKPVSQDLSFLLDGASALPGARDPRDFGHAPLEREIGRAS